jgi:hypothetical protein
MAPDTKITTVPKIGDITMANELLYAKIDKLEAGGPLARRRSRT